jgi:uncharacterized membrane protein YfcA
MDLTFFIVGGLCVLLTGISKSGFAGGLGVIAVPMMSLFVSPQDAAAIMLPILCVIDWAGVWKYRKDWIAKYIILIFPSALIGIGLGTLTFGYVDEHSLKLVIGLFAIWSSAYFFFKKTGDEAEKKINPVKSIVLGAFSGFGSFIAHAGGPPIKILLLSQNLEKSKLVGTNSMFFFLLNHMKIIPYLFLGQFSASNLEMSAYLSIFIPIGVFLGFYLHKRVSQVHFTRIAYTLLFLAGMKLSSDGILGLLS